MFKNLLNPNNSLMITMTWITDCIFLSLFWILGCFPVVTVGASFAALYDATFRAFRRGIRRPFFGDNMEFLEPLQVIWDYLCLKQTPQKADCIVGFGNFNTDIARRAAQLYLDGYAPKILFTGGLGRNTEGLLPEPEAVRFAKVAMECGVPAEDILIEDKSTNTKENIDFTRELLEKAGIPTNHILGVHQPFMERRIVAAMGVYWPDLNFSVTSPQVTIPEYLVRAKEQGISENASISVIAGDFQRMDLYAKKGYQLPQYIPEEAWKAFYALVEMGYDKQLAK